MPARLTARFQPFLFALLLALTLLKPAPPTTAQDRQPVGIELVLLIDVSASVSRLEFHLQLRGLAAAFRNPAIVEAIEASGGVAICVVQWAQEAFQYKSVDWSHVRGAADAELLASRIGSIVRQVPSGQTAIGNALLFGLAELETNTFAGARRVIDLSGDGRSNDGVELKQARKLVLEQGVTINGLAILNEVANLKQYFRDKVIGGNGSFVLTARDYTDFSRAIREKLEMEIRSTPLAGRVNPVPTFKADAGSNSVR